MRRRTPAVSGPDIGVWRPTVSLAGASLQKAGLIHRYITESFERALRD